MPNVHIESEDNKWAIDVADHPGRKDSAVYIKSRALMVEICKEMDVPFYGHGPWQDHHSGCLFVLYAGKWLIFRNLAGIEWSAQFAADPAKVEIIRQNAMALYTRFPETLVKFDDMGHKEQRVILATEIKTAEDVAAWTDSIFNASMPLPQPVHTGTLKSDDDGSKPVAGIHHYPLPVWDIQFIKHDDFVLWVTDEEGNKAAVVPTSHRGKGDARVEVVYAHPGSKLHHAMHASHASGTAHVLDAEHPLAKQAFAKQGGG